MNILEGLVPVASISSGRAPLFDLKDKGDGAYRVSSHAHTALGLDSGKGLIIRSNPTAKVIVFGVVPEENAQIYKHREGSKTKGVSFSHSELRALLDQCGFAGQTEFKLSFVGVGVGESEGIRFYQIQKWEGNTGLTTLDLATPSNGTSSPAPAEVEESDVVEAEVIEDEEEAIAAAPAPAAVDPSQLFS